MNLLVNTMHLQQEPYEPHSIQACQATSVRIQDIDYTHSLLVSRTQLDPHWSVQHLSDLTLTCLEDLLPLHPEVILIGYHSPMMLPPTDWLLTLSQKRIGFECMRIDAACRTFNILLSEHRQVVLGLIF